MALQMTKRDKMLISGTTLLLLIMTIIGWLLIGQATLIITSIFALLLLLTISLEAYRGLSNHLDRLDKDWRIALNNAYKRMDALFSIFFTIRPNLPLPNTGGWAASPILLKQILETIFMAKPDFVLETGSGVSTLMIAYCLRRLGKGKVFSFEHDPKFASESRDMISSHDLERIATIVHAPLKEIKINNDQWLWYDTTLLKIEQPIDLLIIDGPPGPTQPLARYPALPLFYKYLSEDAVIILDDANREDERKIVERWKNEYNNITSEYNPSGKGTFFIYKNKRLKKD